MKVLSKFVMTGLSLLMLGVLVSASVNAESNWWEGTWTVTPPNHGDVTWILNGDGTAAQVRLKKDGSFDFAAGFVPNSGKYTHIGSSLTIDFSYADYDSPHAQHRAEYQFLIQSDRRSGRLSGRGQFSVEKKPLGEASITKQ